MIYRCVKRFFMSLISRCAYKLGLWASEYTRSPKCPYCGADCCDSTKGQWFDGDTEEIECDVCQKTYERTVDVDITWSTEKLDKEGY